MSVKPDLDRLRWFAALSDRDDAPFFIGREAEIAAVGDICANTITDVRNGLTRKATTRLFQGAPGAGKSALLAEMTRRWTKDRTPSSPPLPVTLEVEDFEAQEKVVRKILDAIAPGLEKASRRSRSTDNESGISLSGLFGIKGRKGTLTVPRELSFYELAQMLPGKKWPRPVALMVDEIQTVQPDAVRVLRPLHLGELGLPIVPVLAGLGSSRAALWHAGLTRLADGAERGIGVLSEDEAMQAVERMLDAYGVVRAGDYRPWASWLAERSEGWPQHLHNGMAALAEELVRTGGVLREVDGGAVGKLEKQRRERSYGARVSNRMRNSRFLVGALLAGLTGADGETPPATDIRLDSVAAIDETERLVAENGHLSSGWRLPPGMDATAFFDHMVHRGVFHQDGENGPYSCPIPSLASYLVRNGAGMGNEPRRAERPAGQEDGLPEPAPEMPL